MLVKISKYQQKLSNLEKEFWSEPKIYKGDLIKYYVNIAEYILPHIKDRPMVMKRYPDGIYGKSFYQKQCPSFAPNWLEKINVDKKQMLIINNIDALIWIINLGCIELHPWLAKKNDLDKPDIIVFDLDPEPPATFKDSLKVSLLIKEILDSAGLKSFPKTSGSEGIHVYVPIKPLYTHKVIKEAVKKICEFMVVKYPNLVTTEISKEKRKGKVYLDYLQNGYGKTMASVYSVRPLKGAPVSTPITWEEIKSGLNLKKFNIFNIEDRLKKYGDLFKPVSHLLQDFSPLVNTIFFGIGRKF